MRGEGCKRHFRILPCLSWLSRPASSKTRRCFEIAGKETGKGFASSDTESSPSASRSIMARRVGSERAEKVVSRLDEGCFERLVGLRISPVDIPRGGTCDPGGRDLLEAFLMVCLKWCGPDNILLFG